MPAQPMIGADQRSAFPTYAGVPWWGAVLIAVGMTLAGLAVEAGSGHQELGSAFAVGYSLGCVIAVLAVRQSGVFTAVIQPPLLLSVAVPVSYYLLHKSAFTGLKELLITCGYPLIERFPLMLFTTSAVLLLGLVRWYFAMAHPDDPDVDAVPTRTARRSGGLLAGLSTKLSSAFAGNGSVDEGRGQRAARPRHVADRPAARSKAAKPAKSGKSAGSAKTAQKSKKKTRKPAAQATRKPNKRTSNARTPARSRSSRPPVDDRVAPPRSRSEAPPRRPRPDSLPPRPRSDAPPRPRPDGAVPRPRPDGPPLRGRPDAPLRPRPDAPLRPRPEPGRRPAPEAPRRRPREPLEPIDPRPARREPQERRGYRDHPDRYPSRPHRGNPFDPYDTGRGYPPPAGPSYPPREPRPRPAPNEPDNTHHPVSRVRYRDAPPPDEDYPR